MGENIMIHDVCKIKHSLRGLLEVRVEDIYLEPVNGIWTAIVKYSYSSDVPTRRNVGSCVYHDFIRMYEYAKEVEDESQS